MIGDMNLNATYPLLQVVESTSDQGDEKAITAMGLLNTMETILTVMEDKEEVHAELEPIVLQAVRYLSLLNGVIVCDSEFQ